MAASETPGARQLFLQGDWERLPTYQLAPLVVWHVLSFAARELIRNRGTILTASLAFVSALAIVPMLSVAVSVLAALNFPASDIQPYLQRLFPASAGAITAYLDQFAQTSAVSVAGIGSLAFLVIGLFLFIAIESVFNIVWASERERTWFQKSVAFFLLMTSGPVIVSLSFALTTRAQFRLSQFGADTALPLQLLPFVLGIVFFTLMNQFLPTARVQWWASLLAGVFSATAFELGKWGFNLYVTEVILVPYSQIYGALGLFPIFLVWLYVTWIIIIVGAELAYCSQNLKTLAFVESVKRRRPSMAADHVFNPLIGLELYTPIARAFKSGDGRVAEKDLLTQTGYPESVIRGVISTLEQVGALDIVEDEAGERRLLPAKQLDDIRLLPLVDAFFDFDIRPTSAPMADLLGRYRSATLDVLRGLDALALIPRDAEEERSVATRASWDPLPASTLGDREPDWDVPEADADPFESPPDDSQLPFAATQAVEPLRDREVTKEVSHSRAAATNATPPPSFEEVDEEPPPPAVVSADRDSTDDGIEIDTRDILVEEAEEDDAVEVVDRSSAGSHPRLSRKKETSIEIDIAGMWEDFEVDNHDEILQATADELRQTEEIDQADIELGDELSQPPPVPDKK